MKSCILILSISVISIIEIFPQTPDTLWTKVLPGFIGYSVSQATDEGFIIGGSTSPTGGSSLLIKTNSSGDTNWTKIYTLSEPSEFRCVQQSDDGGFVCAGATYSWSGDIWLVKTDSSGSVRWTKTYGGTGVDWASEVKQTFDGGYVIVGSTNSFAFPNGHLWLLKTDASGDTLWTKLFGGESMYHIGRSICQTTDSGFVITGYTAPPNGSVDLWLIKTDFNGNLIWMKTYGGTGWDEGGCIRQTNDGGFIITGRTESIGSGYYDVWLIRVDSAGDTVWTKTFGGIDLDEGNSVYQTIDNGYIITGTSEPFGSGNRDLLLIKTDNDGNILWSRNYGGGDEDEGYSLQQTNDYGYIISGRTNSFAGFNKSIWLLKISPDPSEVVDENSSPLRGFNLEQNYPNTFNPSTTIRYEIPEQSFVTIKVYDVLGNEIAVLVNEEKATGEYEVEFNGANLPDGKAGLPSGIYFYQLKAGPFVETKKMVLMK